MRKFVAVMVALGAPQLAGAQISDSFSTCAAVADDTSRLACYDQVMGRTAAPAPATGGDAAAPAGLRPATAAAEPGLRVAAVPTSALGQRWELDPGTDRGTFGFSPYRQNYAVVKLMNRSNDYPFRELAPTQPSNSLEVDDQEVKFQLSFKSKLASDVFGTGSNIWFAYTQQSNWQVFNSDTSRPFRETNYEPEIMWVTPLDVSLGSFKLRYATLGLNHQSNGRADPLSRSWNRVFAEIGGESGNFALWFRPWFRIEEDAEDDDNPDIEKYIGRGEIVAAYRHGDNIFSTVVRNNFSLNENRGSVTADWSFPVAGSLRGYVRVFNGYGESMIDYNWSQTTLGVGIILTDMLW